MERTRKNKTAVSAILTSDWHLIETHPVCRTDNFCDVTQWRKVDFIADLQKQHGCPVFHGGDLFNHWKPSPELLSMASKHLPDKFHSIYGQHDLPQHSLDLAQKSGLHNLIVNGKVSILGTGSKEAAGCSWKEEPTNVRLNENKRNILVWHTMVYQKKEFWMPEAGGSKAISLLKKYSNYDLILTGDNHQSFVETYQGRLLVNPGSIFRRSADQIDFKPSVYLWYAETNTVERVYIPIEIGVVTREHIDSKEQSDGRIDAFINKLNTDWEVSMSFEDNLKAFFIKNDTKEPVRQIIYKNKET